MDKEKIKKGIQEAMAKPAPDEQWFAEHYPKSYLEAELERLREQAKSKAGSDQ